MWYLQEGMFEQAIHVHINHKPQPFKEVTQDLTRVAEHSTGRKSQMFQGCRSHEMDQRDWVWGRSWKVGQFHILLQAEESCSLKVTLPFSPPHCYLWSYCILFKIEAGLYRWNPGGNCGERVRMSPARSLGSGWLSHKRLLPWPPLSQGDSTAAIISVCSH